MGWFGMKHIVASLVALSPILSVWSSAMPPRAFARIVDKPASVSTNAAGNILVDFGSAAFGWLEFADSAPGEYELNLGEIVRDGAVWFAPTNSNIRNVRLSGVAGRGRFRVPMKPNKRNTWLEGGALPLPSDVGVVMPFRAAEFVRAPFAPTAQNVRRVSVRYDYDLSESAFRCSDARLNRIYDFCKRSLVNCSFCGLFVDGDRERLPYEGDSFAQQLASYAISSDPDIAAATFEHLMDHPTWPTEGKYSMVMMAWYDWEWMGRTNLVAKWYDRLVAEKLRGDRSREDGLLVTNVKTDLTDWPPCERDGFVFRPVNASVNAYYAKSLEMMSQIARAIGRSADAGKFADEAEKIRRRYNEVFFDERTGLYVDGEGTEHSSMHVNALALAFDLAPRDRIRRVADFLVSKGPTGSPYFTHYLFAALLKAGREKEVFDMVLASGDRSWLGMMDFGATLALEAWNLRVKPNLDANHAWACTPLPFVARYVLGVNPTEPGSGRFVVTPHLGPLEWAEGDVPTPSGKMHVRAVKRPGGTVETTCELRR